MKKLLAAGAAAGFVLLGAGIAPASAAPPAGQICEAWDSGKIEVAEGITTLTIEAPYGMKISKICVKAGSVQQKLGATFLYPNPSRSVTFEHPSGKDISHYSFSYSKNDDECVYNGHDCDYDEDDDYGYGY